MSVPRAVAGAVRLRAAGPFDLATLAALHAACFAERWDSAAMAALLSGPGCAALVALLDERPVGFVLLRTAGDEAEIITIGVDPAFRRRHIGSRLLEEACAQAARAGAQSLYLEVAEDDAGARRFYATAGFEPVGHRRGYYRRPQGRADALVLRRVLMPRTGRRR